MTEPRLYRIETVYRVWRGSAYLGQRTFTALVWAYTLEEAKAQAMVPKRHDETVYVQHGRPAAPDESPEGATPDENGIEAEWTTNDVQLEAALRRM